MKKKILNTILILSIALIIAGIIILVIGFYYSVFKAGIPYQDAPIELQIQYDIDYNIGNVLTKIGFLTTICSGVICAVLFLIKYFLRKES